MGLFKVPFFNMINFSTTCGMGRNGARSMNTAKRIKSVFGILSISCHMFPPLEID